MPGGLARIPRGLLGWLLGVVLWLVWTPWSLAGSRVALGMPTSWSEVLLNLALLGPAALVVAVNTPRSIRDGKIVVGIFIAAAAVSGLIELVQWWWTALGRVAAPADVVLNATGAGLVAWLGLRLRRHARPGTISVAAGAIVFAGVALYLTAAALIDASDLRISGWDPEYAILAGDEMGGGRSFRGTVSEAEICAGEFGDAEERVCGGPGAATATRRRLVEIAEQSQRVQVAATVRSGASAQTGPARIVTFSADVRRRNLTLGQQERDLVLRVRTPLAGPNGSEVVFALPDAVRPGVVTRVEASFDHGLVRIRARSDDGRQLTGTFPAGLLASWWFIRFRGEARQMQPGTMLGVSLMAALSLFFPIGLAVGAATARRRFALVLPAVATGPLLLYGLNHAVGLGTATFELLSSAVVVGLALMAGRRDLARIWNRQASAMDHVERIEEDGS